MDRPIEGHVAAIIDDTTLVLNVGLRHGVSEGMPFVVFGEHAEIVDPITGASLGHWECVKARVVVTHVQESMCTVRAPAARPHEVTDGSRPLSAVMVEHSLGRYGPLADQWQRLEVRAADLRGRPRTQPIAVGDKARSTGPAGVGSVEPGAGVTPPPPAAAAAASPAPPAAGDEPDAHA